MVRYISPLYSFINYLANLLHALFGIKLSRVTYESVAAKLSSEARKDLEADSGLKERLRLACLMVDQDGSITFYGRQVISARLADGLKVRSALLKLRQREPSLTKIQIVKPLVLVNLPRTGSTVVHRLLENDKRFICPLAWEMEHTHDLKNPEVQEICNFEKYFFPQRLFGHMHMMGPKLADESTGMMNRDFLSSDLPALYSEEFSIFTAEQTVEQWAELYENLKNSLQVILGHRGYDNTGRKLVIKMHSNMLNLPALLRVFPDAVIVMGHRNPLECIPSLCSMGWTFVNQFTTGWKKAYIGLKMNWWIYSAARQQIQQRKLVLEERQKQGLDAESLFVDFGYKAMMRDTLGTMREVYKRVGVELTKQTEDEIKSYLANNKQGKHGAHSYTLEEYGLSKSYMEQTWKEYYQYFEKYL